MAAGRGMLWNGVPRPPWGAGDICPHREQGEIPLDQCSPAAGGKGRSAQQLASVLMPFPVFTIRNYVGFLLFALLSLFFFPVFPAGDNVDGARPFWRSSEGWRRSGCALEACREGECHSNQRSVRN